MLCFQVCNITRWWQFPPIGNGRNRCNVSLNLDNPKSLWIYKKYYKVIMICLCTSCIKYRNDSGNLVHYRWNSRCLCMSTLWNNRPNPTFPLFGSATICRSFSCIRWSSCMRWSLVICGRTKSLQTIFGMNGMRSDESSNAVNYSRNLWI